MKAAVLTSDVLPSCLHLPHKPWGNTPATAAAAAALLLYVLSLHG